MKAKDKFIREIEKKPKLKVLAKKLGKYMLCDNCLGRQFALVSTGMTNRERGQALRRFLGKSREAEKCIVCSGLFKKLGRFAAKAAKKMKGIDFNTFLAGTIISEELQKREERLWQRTGIKYCEPAKSEINREFGKLLWKKTGKDVDDKAPDIVVMLNLMENKTELKINPVFFYGKYKKLARGLPQTKWEKYPETVEDIIAGPFMKATKGTGHSFHGAGREDIDARCLDWRPFVFEIKEPKKRNIDLKKITAEINKGKKVRVSRLRHSSREEVRRVKSIRPEKTYMLLVEFEKPPERKSMEKLKSIAVVEQKTPQRVLHRRADLLRRRRLKGIKWRKKTSRRYEFIIRGEAGLYAKELVTGDNGRTSPSISGILGIRAKVINLDVVKIHLK